MGLCCNIFYIKKGTKKFNKNIFCFFQFIKVTHKNIVSVSNYSKNDIKKHYGIKESDILVIPNGIDTSTFNPSNYSEKIRKRYGNKILLNTGLMVPRKRIPVLLKAIVYVIKEIPDVYLVIIERRPSIQKLKNISKSLGIEKKTYFLYFFKHIR